MRKNKKHKQLIKEIKQHTRCTITPEDIYKNTDFFENKQPKKLPSYKLAFMISVIVVFISLTISSLLIIQNHKLRNKEPEIIIIEKNFYIIDDTYGMPLSEKEKLNKSYSYFSNTPVCSYVHDESKTFYVYYGTNNNIDGTKTYYYYYAFSDSSLSFNEIKIFINNETIIVDNDQKYGLLATIDEQNTTGFILSFTIESDLKTREYVLKDCNY